MNIEERIARRHRPADGPQLVRDYDALSPIVHLRDPDGRGSVLEQLLDHLEPTLNDDLPPNCYVWGPKGAGKSALLTALFSELRRASRETNSGIHTSTRVANGGMTDFAYVDARETRSEFSLLHAILDALLDEHVPRQGVGRERLDGLLNDRFFETGRQAVVAIDHLEEPETYPIGAVESFLESPKSISWIAVARTPPAEHDTETGTAVQLPAYQRYVLVDILTSRVSQGLARYAISHEQLRRIARWAEGDAHDALAVLFGAAVLASESDERAIEPETVTIAMNAVPRPNVAIGRVLALQANRQHVLRNLLDLDTTEKSIGETAEALTRDESLGLSTATITRYLYELAEVGVLERVQSRRTADLGRPPSRVEPRFPTLVFRRLFDAQRR
jgi:Cdc6-like AAA superfamily ATPase